MWTRAIILYNSAAVNGPWLHLLKDNLDMKGSRIQAHVTRK